MKSIKAIIVDDEVAARDVLFNLIVRAKSAVEVVAKCSGLEEAVQAIKEHKPNVVFLDVQMPNFAGYEIASFFDTIDFEIIFVTAYDQYAIKAFELNAIDYLVKPISRQRLQESLNKLTERIEQKDDVNRFHDLLESMKSNDHGKIVISELGAKRIITLSDIIAIEAKGAYCTIHLKNDNALLVSKNLKHFESLLPSESTFYRSHKSWIVSKTYIESYSKSNGEIELSQNITARVSRYRIQDLEKLLNE